MTLSTAVETYFRAERDLGLALAVGGLALGAISAWVWRTQTGPFALALVIPLSLTAIAFMAGGGLLAKRSEGQRTTLARQAETDTAALIAAETPRMDRVNGNWRMAMTIWSALIVVALVLLMAVRHEAAHGVGLALLVLSTSLFFVDVFGERRALVYASALAGHSKG